jgi:hypothetical protein
MRRRAAPRPARLPAARDARLPDSPGCWASCPCVGQGSWVMPASCLAPVRTAPAPRRPRFAGRCGARLLPRFRGDGDVRRLSHGGGVGSLGKIARHAGIVDDGVLQLRRPVIGFLRARHEQQGGGGEQNEVRSEHVKFRWVSEACMRLTGRFDARRSRAPTCRLRRPAFGPPVATPASCPHSHRRLVAAHRNANRAECSGSAPHLDSVPPR